MTGYLLDTNVLSELMKKRPAKAVLTRLAEVPARSLHTSAVTVMELRFGAVRHPRGAALWTRIEREVLSRVRVLPFDRAAASRAGEVLAALEAVGTPIGIEDVQIAATALAHDMMVVTRNLRHLSRVPGLRAQSWWG